VKWRSPWLGVESERVRRGGYCAIRKGRTRRRGENNAQGEIMMDVKL
jgi:hypothetical protein